MSTGRGIAALVLAGTIVACSGARRGAGQGRETSVATKSIDEVLAAHSDSLLALPGVVGTAVGLCDAERCIKVLVADANPDTQRRIPVRLEGYRVVVEVTGLLRPR